MTVIQHANQAKQASRLWQRTTSDQRSQALLLMADLLEEGEAEILGANAKDLRAAKEKNISGALLDRLTLNKTRISQMAEGLREVAAAPDPIGEVVSGALRPNGMQIQRIRVPLGVIAMIYEARPNVTADATGLALKSGNVVILRGGSEALQSNIAITQILQTALSKLSLPADAVQVLTNTDREHVRELMGLNGLIDVIIPRGGAGLIKTVVENSTVPVIETGVGNCHIFVDDSAQIEPALRIVDNAKTQRPGVCNAVETLLVHQGIAPVFLNKVAAILQEKGVVLRGCAKAVEIVPSMEEASDSDWSTEYLDLILAVKVVADLDQAIDHISRFSSGHSEAILTENYTNAHRFVEEVDAAAVYINASTRFTDGSQFGMGAEIGISTQKLHARGPMGLRELTTTKYIISGKGNSRD